LLFSQTPAKNRAIYKPYPNKFKTNFVRILVFANIIKINILQCQGLLRAGRCLLNIFVDAAFLFPKRNIFLQKKEAEDTASCNVLK